MYYNYIYMAKNYTTLREYVDAQSTEQYSEIRSKESLSNKKTDIESNRTSNIFYATVKAIYDWAVGKFQLKLVSGINIKTLNFESLLGGGNIVISGSSGTEHEYNIHSTDSTIRYIGIAPIGTLTSSIGWTITRITITALGVVTVAYPTNPANELIYNDRETLTYA